MQRMTRWLAVLITMAMLLAHPLMGNFARAADGEGDGSGGGKSNPLAIESSIPADGATGVVNIDYIKIVFTKNIAYMTIRDNNQKCFSLWSDGQKIPAEIVIADDQIEPEKRNDVLIKPLQPFKSGATYKVEIAPELQSKSGVFLGQKTSVTFTMAGVDQPLTVADKPVSAPAAGINPSEVAQNPVSVDPAAQGTPHGESQTAAPASSTAQKDSAEPGISSNYWLWIVLAAAVLGLAGWYYRKSRQP